MIDDFKLAGFGEPPSTPFNNQPAISPDGGNFNKALLLLGIALLLGLGINYLDNVRNRQQKNDF